MVDPDSLGDLYRYAEGALRSVRDGLSSAQTSNVAREAMDGLFQGDDPAAEIPSEPITPNFDLPEDI
jgi:hypothetical protein